MCENEHSFWVRCPRLATGLIVNPLHYSCSTAGYTTRCQVLEPLFSYVKWLGWSIFTLWSLPALWLYLPEFWVVLLKLLPCVSSKWNWAREGKIVQESKQKPVEVMGRVSHCLYSMSMAELQVSLAPNTSPTKASVNGGGAESMKSKHVLPNSPQSYTHETGLK